MTLTTGDLIEIGLVALLLLWYWRLGQHWSKVPYRPKPPRDRSKDWRWVIWIGWTLPR
jgi:hypothetical protein